MIRTFQFTACLLSGIAIAIAVGPARAQGIIVDQEALTPLRWWGSIRYLGQIGQEFVPVHGAINVVELWISNINAFPPGDAEVMVCIREDSISGTTIGTSSTKIIADGSDGEAVRFTLLPAVTVQPGARYVCEVRSVVNHGNATVQGDGGGFNTYPRGRAVMLGSPENNDLWFRVGMLDMATPNLSGSWGELKSRFRR